MRTRARKRRTPGGHRERAPFTRERRRDPAGNPAGRAPLMADDPLTATSFDALAWLDEQAKLYDEIGEPGSYLEGLKFAAAANELRALRELADELATFRFAPINGFVAAVPVARLRERAAGLRARGNG